MFEKFEGGLIGIKLFTLVIPMIRYYNLWLFDWNTSTRTILNCFPQDNITSFIDNYNFPWSPTEIFKFTKWFVEKTIAK